MTEAEYVIVGAGSAGCAVASRLAEQNAGVVLIEAGGPDSSRFVRVPGMIAPMHSVPQVRKRFDWGFTTVPQEHALQRQIPSTRGKVLGGSSSVNGMLFVRGNRADYDGWAADGCDGWSYADVLPSFKRMEDWEEGASELRGAGGPIKVTRQRDLTNASTAFVESLSDTACVPKLDDYNGAEQEGAGVFQESAADGLRYSSSRGYLNGNANLRVLTRAQVLRLTFSGNRVTGVEIAEKSGRRRVISAEREVVLAAGVFGTPHLLLLSGIGPAGHLRDLGITVRADLPVGKNLHDHLFVPMTFLMPSAMHRSTALHFTSGVVREMLRGRSWFGRTVFEAVAFVRSSQASDRPDLQFHTLPWSYPAPNQDAPVIHRPDKRPALTVLPTLIYPQSRGEVRLASPDPTVAPLIDPAYLAEPADADVLIEGIQLTREIMANQLIAGDVRGELHPGDAYRDETALREELPNRVHSVYHPVGTCRMGTDERAVVDPQLRVRGIEGLRVADASIMPTVTGGNTNAPAMMIGERCAELLT